MVAQRGGSTIPGRAGALLDTAYGVWDAAMPFWRAFMHLSPRRQQHPGFGVLVQQPIQYTELEAYAKTHGFLVTDARGRVIRPHRWREFLRLLDALDGRYLSHANASKKTGDDAPADDDGAE